MKSETSGRCKKCGSNNLELHEGNYICKECGNKGNYEEWVDND